MTITYRTTGAWGVGLGADLSAVQIDNNFWDLHGRLVIQEAQPNPAAIDDFEIDGNQLTVIMDDATTRGPYTLPTYVPSSFVWEPGIDVVPGQMFSQGSTIYTVIAAHTTVDPFDAGESGTDGDFYQEFITVDGPSGGTVKTVSATTYTGALVDANCYIRCTNAAGCTVTIPLNGDVEFPIGSELHFRQCAAGSIVFDGAGAVVINPPRDGYDTVTPWTGATVTLKKVATNEWDYIGLGIEGTA